MKNKKTAIITTLVVVAIATGYGIVKYNQGIQIEQERIETLKVVKNTLISTETINYLFNNKLIDSKTKDELMGINKALADDKVVIDVINNSQSKQDKLINDIIINLEKANNDKKISLSKLVTSLKVKTKDEKNKQKKLSNALATTKTTENVVNSKNDIKKLDKLIVDHKNLMTQEKSYKSLKTAITKRINKEKELAKKKKAASNNGGTSNYTPPTSSGGTGTYNPPVNNGGGSNSKPPKNNTPVPKPSDPCAVDPWSKACADTGHNPNDGGYVDVIG